MKYALFHREDEKYIANALLLVRTGSAADMGPKALDYFGIGTLFYRIISIPLHISSSPYAVLWLYVFFNVFAVFLSYVFVRKFFDAPTAVMTASLFATSQTAVIFCRRIWNPYLMGPFVLLFFYSVFSLVSDKKSSHAAWAAVWLAVLLQFNLSALSFIPVLLIALFIRRRQLSLSGIFVAIGAFIIVYMPVILNMVSQGFVRLNNMAHTSREQDIGTLLFRAFINPFRGLTLNMFAFKMSMADYMYAAFLAVAFISVAVWAFRPRKGGGEDTLKFRFLVIWFLLPSLFLLVFRIYPQFHYTVLLYPVQFLFMAIFLKRVFDAVCKTLKINGLRMYYMCLAGIILLIMSYQVSNIFYLDDKVRKEEKVCIFYPFDLTLSDKIKVARAILDDCSNNRYVWINRVCGMPPVAWEHMLGYWYIFGTVSEELAEDGAPIKDEEVDTAYVIIHESLNNGEYLRDWLSSNSIDIDEIKVSENIRLFRFDDSSGFTRFKEAFDLRGPRYPCMREDTRLKRLFI